MKVKVTYEGLPNALMDRDIRAGLEREGLVWYAQGHDHEKNERDICFDWTKQKVSTGQKEP